MDLGYVLAHKDMIHYFLSFENGSLFEKWLKIIHFGQGMDNSILRILEQHSEWDSEWWIGCFAFELELMNFLPLILEGIRYREKSGDKEKTPEKEKYSISLPTFRNILFLCTKELINWLTTNLGTISNVPIDFQVSAGFNTFHLPLHRYLAGLLYEGMKLWKLSLDEFLVVSEKHAFLKYLIEHPLRIQVLNSQIRSGLWNRNGKEVWASSQSYESVYFRDFMKQLDIFILQVGSIVLGAAEFLKICIRRFELNWWKDSFQTLVEEEKKMFEEFLRFIILIACDRTKTGMSEEALIR